MNAIDFSSIVVATDADGDEVVRRAGASRSRFRTTSRFRLRTDAGCGDGGRGRDGRRGGRPPEGLNGIDLSTGNKEVGDTNADDEASGGLGSLSGLFSVGADEPLTISLSTTTSGLPALLSKGEAVT